VRVFVADWLPVGVRLRVTVAEAVAVTVIDREGVRVVVGVPVTEAPVEPVPDTVPLRLGV
jgi:hypothetical protein